MPLTNDPFPEASFHTIQPIATYASPSSILSEGERRLQRSPEFLITQRTRQQQQKTGTYDNRCLDGLSCDFPTIFGPRLGLGTKISPPHPSWDFLPPESGQRPPPEQTRIREPPMFYPPPCYERGPESLLRNEFGAVGDAPRSDSAARAMQLAGAGSGSLSSTPPEPMSPSSRNPGVLSDSSTPGVASIRRGTGRYGSQRRPGNRNEFDGPVQLLEKPASDDVETLESDLPQLPTNLNAQEQDEILRDVNEWLSRCAFDFVAEYQFPIPIEPDKRQVRNPTDRHWIEWAYLLKWLAIKRRIPARVLYNGQIKQFVAVLENSLEIISAATQVAKIVRDAPVMEHFDQLYERVESLILNRREQQQLLN